MYETTAHTSRFSQTLCRQELHFNQFLALSHNSNLALSGFQNQALHVLTFLSHKRWFTSYLTHVLVHLSSVAVTPWFFYVLFLFFFSSWANACKLDSFCSQPHTGCKTWKCSQTFIKQPPFGNGQMAAWYRVTRNTQNCNTVTVTTQSWTIYWFSNLFALNSK